MSEEKVPLVVKWGKETVSVHFVPATGVKGLKAELEEATGVPADRMKLMPKSKGLWKGVLKEDVDLANDIDWKAALAKAGGAGLQVLLMGSATKLAAPKTKTVFVEDMAPEERAAVAEPSGLINLGNTCYLNSVVQCLRAIPSFRKGLTSYQHVNSSTVAGSLTAQRAVLLTALRETYAQLDRQTDPLQPAALVHAVKMAFPQFNQRSRHGQPMQQDAEEFYSGLLTTAAEECRDTTTPFEVAPSPEELAGATNLVDAVFGMKMKETLTCDEEGSEEPPVETEDLHRKLVCNIQGGQAAAVNVSHIYEGIQLGLTGKIEKHSEKLGRDAVWTRTQKLARCPPVLTVQFGRFYWKATPDSQDHAGVKCKVMKPVAFDSILDIYDYCTPDVQKVLKVARDKALAIEDARVDMKLKGEDMAIDKPTEEEATAAAKEEEAAAATPMETEDDDEQAALQAALAMSMEAKTSAVGPGLPDDFQGIYELFAVVTHKGRDADGGHYMSWVKSETQGDNKKIADTEEENEDWYVFDDDEVSPCKTEDVLKLKGGGDWHMSYLNFYRAKK